MKPATLKSFPYSQMVTIRHFGLPGDCVLVPTDSAEVFLRINGVVVMENFTLQGTPDFSIYRGVVCSASVTFSYMLITNW
jgi:hypothetical protein